MPAAAIRVALGGIVALLVVVAHADGGSSAADSDLTIGIVPQRAFDDDEAELMADAGIASVRSWFPWATTEARRGTYQWATLDGIVEQNAEAGMATLPFLFGLPQWAATLDEHDCYASECVRQAPRSTVTRQAFADFAGAAVRRYGPSGVFWNQHKSLPYRPIRAWQIWNEPNLMSFWGPAVDPYSYAALVQVAADEIRDQDPNAEVLLGGLTGTKSNRKRMSSVAFLTALYGVQDIAESFDGIAVHPYSRRARDTMAQIKTARRIATVNEDEVEIWVTELGWASAGKRQWGLVKSPSGQARQLRATFERLIEDADDLGIRAAYWYSWRDTDRGQAVCGWCPWSGLLDRVGREKPAYRALVDVAGGG
jgi:hypothetical protein